MNTMTIEMDRRFPAVDQASTVVVGCHPQHYCASLLARAFEDCNAQVLNLNVLAPEAPAEEYAEQAPIMTTVEVRVNRPFTSSLTRSLERYGYEVLDAQSTADPDMDTMRDRVNELLRYLDL